MTPDWFAWVVGIAGVISCVAAVIAVSDKINSWLHQIPWKKLFLYLAEGIGVLLYLLVSFIWCALCFIGGVLFGVVVAAIIAVLIGIGLFVCLIIIAVVLFIAAATESLVNTVSSWVFGIYFILAIVYCGCSGIYEGIQAFKWGWGKLMD